MKFDGKFIGSLLAALAVGLGSGAAMTPSAEHIDVSCRKDVAILTVKLEAMNDLLKEIRLDVKELKK